MGAGRFDDWDSVPIPLAYRSRVRPPWPAGWPHRRVVPVTAAVRATAVTVVAGCLMVAVPCLVFAGVGLWFDDLSAVDAAWTAASCGTAAAVAAVPAVVCHRRIARRLTAGSMAAWN